MSASITSSSPLVTGLSSKATPAPVATPVITPKVAPPVAPAKAEKDNDSLMSKIMSWVWFFVMLYAIFYSFKLNKGFSLGSFLLAIFFSPVYLIYGISKIGLVYPL